jgi:hypothetical protein
MGGDEEEKEVATMLGLKLAEKGDGVDGAAVNDSDRWDHRTGHQASGAMHKNLAL